MKTCINCKTKIGLQSERVNCSPYGLTCSFRCCDEYSDKMKHTMTNKHTEDKCEHCNGKGYNTQIYGEHYSADFIGDKSYDTAPTIHKITCKTCKGTGIKPAVEHTEDIREQLAELEHKQWMTWALSLQANEKISPERLKRWEKLIVPYYQLNDEEKEQDREWADKVLAIMEENKERCPHCRGLHGHVFPVVEHTPEWEKEWLHNEELKRTFDLWVLNFGIKDGIGGKPDWFSLAHANYFIMKAFISSLIEQTKKEATKAEHDRWANQSANDHDEKIRKEAEVKERMRMMEILHWHAMNTEDPMFLTIIKNIQQEMLEDLSSHPTKK